MKPCPSCGGDGKETCLNPDHGFIDALSFLDLGRIGCPGCAHDPNHKLRHGDPCEDCNGTGLVAVTCVICGNQECSENHDDGSSPFVAILASED